jgi:hypothetical protein
VPSLQLFCLFFFIIFITRSVDNVPTLNNYYISHRNNYYRKKVNYHDVFPSILAEFSGERWTGFGEMSSSTASVWDSTVLVLACILAAEDGIQPKPVKRSPEFSVRIDGRTSR